MEAINRSFAIDISRHAGDARGLIDSARAYARRFTVGEIMWFVRPDQAELLKPDDALIVCDHPTLVSDVITAWVGEKSAESRSSILHVISYDASVLGTAAAMNDRSLVVVTMHFGALTKLIPVVLTDSPSFNKPPGPSSPLSFDDAVELAKEVLRFGGYTSEQNALHQPQLRAQMAIRDQRATKNYAYPSSVKLITRVVETGLEQGWLRRMRRAGQTGTEYVWLVEDDPQAGRGREAVCGNATSLQEQGRDEGYPLKNISERTNEEGAPIIHAGRAQGRAAIMESHLRRQAIGSPGETRAFLFDAVQEVLSKSVAIRLADLMFFAEEGAKRLADARGYAREKNWQAVTGCFFRMMLAAGGLLKPDGAPITEGLGSYSSDVGSSAADLRDRCESYLVEQIVRGMNDMTLDDVFNVGLTLYQRGGQNPRPRHELLARADELLSILARQGRIELTPDGHIVAKSDQNSR